ELRIPWGQAPSKSTPGPALPHAELEDREVCSLEQAARRDHHVGGGGAATLRQREHLLARFDLRRVGLAYGGPQRLQCFGAQPIAPAVRQSALELGRKLLRLHRAAVAASAPG